MIVVVQKPTEPRKNAHALIAVFVFLTAPLPRYEIMERCWSATPELRPAFNGDQGLVALLAQL